jgi:phosphate transport system substrate-binding protein
VLHVSAPDSLKRLVAAWSEVCQKEGKTFRLEPAGKDAPAGIAALKKGTSEIVLFTHELQPLERIEVTTGPKNNPQEFQFGFDALVVFVHPSNPVKEISMEQLTGVWTEGGAAKKWEQLNDSFTGDIVLAGEKPNSGSRDEFRGRICKAGSLRRSMRELDNAAAIVETVSKTPTATGYGSLGGKAPGVSVLKISNVKGEPAVEPNAETVRSGAYPLTCRLIMYTSGSPQGDVKDFVDWCRGPAGQAVLEKEGFVPLATGK